MPEKQTPQHVAMIFDASPSGVYIPIVTSAASEVGWITRDYDSELYAFQDLGDQPFNALVVALDDDQLTHYKGKALLEVAQSLSMPRAVISSMSSNGYIGNNGRNILLPTSERAQIRHRLAGWLLRVATR